MASDARDALRRIGSCSLCRGPVMRWEIGGRPMRRMIETTARGAGARPRSGLVKRDGGMGGAGFGGKALAGGTAVVRCQWCGAAPAGGHEPDAAGVIEMTPCADAARGSELTTETQRTQRRTG